MNDIDVILNALTKERECLHQQLMQIDRIIKRAKSGTYSDEQAQIAQPNKQPAIAPKPASPLNSTDNMRVQLLRIMDIIGKGCKLKAIQDEYTKLAGNKYPIRDALRSLQASGLLYVVKDKRNERGFMWVKKEWVENQLLKDEYKPDGFDLLYQADNITFV